MSTRALYTFKGDTADDCWNVYKHHDGYPTGAAEVLQTTLDFFAWPLPRYEADAFAAAFCAAGKSPWLQDGECDPERMAQYAPGGNYRDFNGGGVRLMPQGDPMQVARKYCSDIAYRYEIYQGNDQQLRVRALATNLWGDDSRETLLTDCPLSRFAAWANQYEDEAA